MILLGEKGTEIRRNIDNRGEEDVDKTEIDSSNTNTNSNKLLKIIFNI